MRIPSSVFSFISLSFFACGSTDPGPAPPGPGGNLPPKGFDPPPVSAGYTRIVAPDVNVDPGADTMVCQYVQAPLDHDVDILDVQGFQSAFGHHAVAYASTSNSPVGSSGPCTDEETVQQGSFLGSVGGEGTGGVKLPDGVAFRLPKGSSILLNVHFLNTSAMSAVGHSILDFKFAEVSPARKIASLFANGNLGFTIPANSTGHASADCTLPRDIEFILFSNHMHDHGTSALTHIARGHGGSVEGVHVDPSWTYEMQFKAEFAQWPLDRPLRIAAGDILHTECNWANATAEAIAFPREMCIGFGYFLSDGRSSPVCMDGHWIER